MTEQHDPRERSYCGDMLPGCREQFSHLNGKMDSLLKKMDRVSVAIQGDMTAANPGLHGRLLQLEESGKQKTKSNGQSLSVLAVIIAAAGVIVATVVAIAK